MEKKEDIIDYKYNCDECDFKNNNKYIYNKHKKAHNKDNYMYYSDNAYIQIYLKNLHSFLQ